MRRPIESRRRHLRKMAARLGFTLHPKTHEIRDVHWQAGEARRRTSQLQCTPSRTRSSICSCGVPTVCASTDAIKVDGSRPPQRGIPKSYAGLSVRLVTPAEQICPSSSYRDRERAPRFADRPCLTLPRPPIRSLPADAGRFGIRRGDCKIFANGTRRGSQLDRVQS